MPIEINTGNAPETESASALADKVREQAAQSILAMANGGATSADESQEQTPPAEKPDESPGERNGDLYGYNSLNRTNWFNGRFMDAEAFLRQDDFWSCRARMLAHIHPPGISWGLGFDMGGARLPDYPVNGALESHADGFSVDHVIALQPGLAFDDVGRPIMVERSHEFSLRELVAKYRERPRVAIAGGTQFSPCVCLRDDIGVLPTDRDAAILPGPYLLIIEAGETPEGEAKVYGEVCKTTRPVYCQANSWRGGYGLSLARYESDIPTDLGIHTGWDLRGTLSAYHFDVLEHSLIERWDPQVFLDGMFCAGTGPYRHDGNLIALAMVYLGPNENVAFFDPWIPRRPQVATAASTWCANMLGAPAPSAAVARLHQFQCMLHESLEKRPMFEVLQKPGQPEKKDISGISRSTFESDNETSQKLRVYFTENPEFVENGMEFTVFEAESDENIVTITADERIDADVSNGSLWWCWTKLGSWAEGVDRITDDDIVRGSVEFSGEPVKFVEPLNLFQRGFRHIPPVGFLPIDPAGVDESFWKRVAEARQNLDGDRREDALRSGYAGTVNGILTRFARDLVKPYFEGTTVFPYYVVALHDDDIFEDIRNAFEKDPIVVQQMRLRWGKDTESKNDQRAFEGTGLLQNAFAMISRGERSATSAMVETMLVLQQLLTPYDLVNRDIEIVKVVIPLQGTRRLHPVLGRTNEDAMTLWEIWRAALMGSGSASQGAVWKSAYAMNIGAYHDVTGIFDAHESEPPAAAATVGVRGPLDSLPRHFVVYVKQRMVLLDAIYFVLDALLGIQAREDGGMEVKLMAEQPMSSTVILYRRRFDGLDEKVKATARAIFSLDEVRHTYISALMRENEDLRVKGRIDAFFAAVDEEETNVDEAITDPDARRERAMDAVLDAYADEYTGFAPIKALAAMLPPDGAEATLREIGRAADLNPAVDRRGRLKPEGLAREVLHGDRIRIWRSDETRLLWGAARHGLGERRVDELVADMPSGARADDVWKLPPEEAKELLGGRANFEEFKEAVRRQADEIAGSIDKLARKPVPRKIAEKYREKLAAAEGDALKAYAETVAHFSGEARSRKYLKLFDPIARKLDAQGFAGVMTVLLRPGRTPG